MSKKILEIRSSLKRISRSASLLNKSERLKDLKNDTMKSNQDDNYRINSQNKMMLLDLNPLKKGILIKRPSACVRSPWVADVKLISDSTSVLAHAPALGVGGLCSPGSTLYLSARNGKVDAKTSHSIELVVSQGCKSSDKDVLVGAHSSLAEKLTERVLQLGLLDNIIGYGPLKLALKKTSQKK